MQTYKVYARVDAAGRILALNSDAFLPEPSGWTLIDEGAGDRYHHAQGNYLPGATYTDNGVPRYKLEDGQVVERTAEEIAAETVEPEAVPTMDERLTELEEALEMLLSGVTE